MESKIINTEKQNQNQLALIKKDVVDTVTNKVREFTTAGELHFPANYSVENAMKSAWLILQETKAKTPDKQEVPALSYCTRDSIANALLSMAVQGLNPAKKQCYFIAYGNQLVCQRSYFGNIYLAKLADPEIEDIVGTTVYEGDEFEYYIYRGKTFIRKHVQQLWNVDKRKIVAAYATVLRKDRDEAKEYSDIMTMEQIKQAWKQSKMYPIDDRGNIKTGSTHDKFTADMAEKTVINGICKQIINTSTDSLPGAGDVPQNRGRHRHGGGQRDHRPERQPGDHRRDSNAGFTPGAGHGPRGGYRHRRGAGRERRGRFLTPKAARAGQPPGWLSCPKNLI